MDEHLKEFEGWLKELAFLNKGNKKIISLIREAHKGLRNLRFALAKYEIV